jgi:hypothetical protein
MNPLTQFKKILILPLLIALASAADIWGESANPILKAGSSVEEEN